ncbi:hypothetical protein SNOG_03255 [Parastagonospora nodorum SN15]|uniref:Uncharacterized protein n=1 Tax=Phaeosphaeria nodorum (strain SN15 / ATCC MYA-4574 / FGSC 10173) TaxID=321614 RepID=Q0UYA9_PHANO|nr:hypothetical protein SNOG_03255 [Parastagonospora nodorum SN15]EAT89986.2 hypothetical protein SNOG_03255 [Parastagonospora nodorum SN15]
MIGGCTTRRASDVVASCIPASHLPTLHSISNVTMPRLDENTQEYLQDAERGVRRHTSWAWDSFSNFALRDNVLEVAVGLIRNLDEKFAILKHGPHYNGTITNGYNTVKQALDDGAVVFAYGSFLDKVVRFVCIALTLWIIAIAYSRGSGDNIVKKQVKVSRGSL